ncbi:MAG: aromatic amino acid transport family protein [Candidatus Nealsonbacteria bacterium]
MVFVKALSIFLGTVIGVGIFGLPYVASKAGFFVLIFYFLIMSLIAISIHFLYGEITLATEKVHRLPGYAEEYLGAKWKKITFFAMLVGLMGALLAYLIVGGEFLFLSLSPYFGGNLIFYTLLFFSLGAVLIFKGIKSISFVELFLLIILFIILGIFFIKTFPVIDINNLKTFDFKFLAFPYGVVLFSLWGSSVVPEIKEMFSNNYLSKKSKNKDIIKLKMRKVIFFGISISTIIYIFFVFMILGVSGFDTSKEAISGLDLALGQNIIKLGFIFGIITCFTSFLTIALTLKKMFWYDFGFSKNLSWAITCFVPLILFFLGMREFIEIIGFTGAVALGVEGIAIVFIYKELLKRKFLRKINPVLYFLVGVFVLGIISETFFFLFSK